RDVASARVEAAGFACPRRRRRAIRSRDRRRVAARSRRRRRTGRGPPPRTRVDSDRHARRRPPLRSRGRTIRRLHRRSHRRPGRPRRGLRHVRRRGAGRGEGPGTRAGCDAGLGRAKGALIMRARSWIPSAALVLALGACATQAHATFIIINNDGPGEGFNDPTPAAPVGGNPGTTVGQQRLNVFTRTGLIWDGILNSPVSIYVDATFDPLPCSPTSGVLGSAGPTVVESDFSGAPYAGTWFNGAEANRLAGTDL